MMQKERWSEAKTKEFIAKYLEKPALWNASSSNYSKKSEKLKAYEALMDEFGLTLTEVRNKIRIYRTTYLQEKNKEQTIPNYKPKLSWYNDMKTRFNGGQVKSFSKSPKTKQTRIIKREKDGEVQSLVEDIHYEYVETEGEIDEGDNVKAEDKSYPTQIIIEPYCEEDDEPEEDSHVEVTREPLIDSKNSQPPSSIVHLSSNELFLQSLKSSLDMLSDEKNMRARIKIQEVLYTIMYEKP